ncbi:MAG: alpha/beta hydrolase [Gemmiger sp.]|nr:alpha/beta hydrolase [Gemmiger sp.]
MWMWLLAVLALLVVVLLVAGWLLSDIIMNPKSYEPPAQMHAEEMKKYNINPADWETGWQRQDFTLQSRYGYPLSCTYIPRRADIPLPDGKERVVVVVHGFGVDRFCSLKYAAMFRDLGFQVVLYDHRNHGTSAKKPTTMGYCEARDLATVCDWARARFGQDCLLGTHGESMGGATVMLHSALDHQLAFVVEDCGYCSVRQELTHVMRQDYSYLPEKLLMPIALLIARLRCGVWMQQVEPAAAVAESGDTPMLFIHGEEDTFVPFAMLAKNAAAKTTGIKVVKTFPGAAHARSYAADPAAYRKTVEDFLKQSHVLPA